MIVAPYAVSICSPMRNVNRGICTSTPRPIPTGFFDGRGKDGRPMRTIDWSASAETLLVTVSNYSEDRRPRLKGLVCKRVFSLSRTAKPRRVGTGPLKFDRFRGQAF
jgi:hypothetical protein